MIGQSIVITGGTAGIGAECAKFLVEKGANVYLIARDPEKGKIAERELQELAQGGQVSFLQCDLSSLEQVRSIANSILALDEPIHALVNNAGILHFGERRESVDGFELTFAVNHLAPYSLTCQLMPAILVSGAGRVITVSSTAHKSVRGFKFSDYNAEKSYKGQRQYCYSKLANILFTKSLAEKLQGTDVSAHAIHPGVIGTSLYAGSGPISKVAFGLLRSILPGPEQAGAKLGEMCCSPEFSQLSGRYFSGLTEKSPSAAAMDQAAARELWELSAELTGVDLTLTDE